MTSKKNLRRRDSIKTHTLRLRSGWPEKPHSVNLANVLLTSLIQPLNK